MISVKPSSKPAEQSVNSFLYLERVRKLLFFSPLLHSTPCAPSKAIMDMLPVSSESYEVQES